MPCALRVALNQPGPVERVKTLHSKSFRYMITLNT
jgi:hypothetical protein